MHLRRRKHRKSVVPMHKARLFVGRPLLILMPVLERAEQLASSTRIDVPDAAQQTHALKLARTYVAFRQQPLVIALHADAPKRANLLYLACFGIGCIVIPQSVDPKRGGELI